MQHALRMHQYSSHLPTEDLTISTGCHATARMQRKERKGEELGLGGAQLTPKNRELRLNNMPGLPPPPLSPLHSPTGLVEAVGRLNRPNHHEPYGEAVSGYGSTTCFWYFCYPRRAGDQPTLRVSAPFGLGCRMPLLFP